MEHHRAGLVLHRRMRGNEAIQEVHVFRRKSGRTHAKALVEPAHVFQPLAFDRDVGAGTDDPWQRAAAEPHRHTAGTQRHGMQARLLGTERQNAPGHDIDVLIRLEGAGDRRQPVRIGNAIVVGERHDRPRARRDGRIARCGEPEPGLSHVGHAHRSGRGHLTNDAFGRIVRALVDDDEFGRQRVAVEQGADAAGQGGRPFHRGNRNRHVSLSHRRLLVSVSAGTAGPDGGPGRRRRRCIR